MWDRAAARTRVEAATPGPWEAGDIWVYTDPVYPDDERLANVLGMYYQDAERTMAERERGLANAQFIAAARTDLPAALDAIDRVHALHREDRFGHCTICHVRKPWFFTMAPAVYPCATVRALDGEQ